MDCRGYDLNRWNERVDEIYNITSGDTSVSVASKKLLMLEKIIKEFFSRDGEGNCIRNLYNVADNFEVANKKIISVDLNMANKMYQEYYQGMMVFYNECINAINDSGLDELLKAKFERAKVNDPKLITSLFGGNMNSEYEYSVKEALHDLEALVDFINQLHEYIENFNKWNDMSNNTEVNVIAVNAIRRFVENSVVHFCAEYVKATFAVYDKLHSLVIE